MKTKDKSEEEQAELTEGEWWRTWMEQEKFGSGLPKTDYVCMD